MPKRYRNDGASTLVIEGKRIQPGEEFEANLPEDYELQMFMGGHLALLKDRSEKEDRQLADPDTDTE